MAANIDNYQPSMEGFNVPVPVPFVDHEKLLEESTMLNNQLEEMKKLNKELEMQLNNKNNEFEQVNTQHANYL